MKNSTRALGPILMLLASPLDLSAQRPPTVPEARCVEVGSDTSCVLYGPSLIELIANPVPYEGKRVRVIGYLHLEFEGNGIYVHRDDLEHRIYSNGLWVDFGAETLKPGAPCLDNYALIEGTFTMRERGHMGLWSGRIKNITRCTPWI
jgi:hypothetical protein